MEQPGTAAVWYYATGRQQQGPVTRDELQAMVDAGQVRADDLVWTEGLAEWVPAAQRPELRIGQPASPAPAGEGVNALSAQGPPRVIPYAGPLSYERRATDIEYAGFWLRFAAHILDAIILRVAGFLLGFSLGFLFSALGAGNDPALLALGNFIGIILAWLYFAVMESSPKQATLGKMACRIVVSDVNGGRISFGRATGRHFSKIISTLSLLIGFIMAGFTERKQALHDMIAGTLVIRGRR